MARLPSQSMTSGLPDKPTNLSDGASREWDRIVSELTDSNIKIAPAHRSLLSNAATVAADIADAWEAVEREGAYITNEKNGALQLHPAARRLDGLRRDYIKVMSLLGLRTPVEGKSSGASLEDILNG